LLKQLVANLIDNAIRHTLAGSRIRVSFTLGEEHNLLIVADNGPGVPRSDQKRIFERFYRVDQARDTPGDGLGLSLVAAIAELHGANFYADDNAPGLKIAIAFPASNTLSHANRVLPPPSIGPAPRGATEAIAEMKPI
jgi:signal transduction histidine kinase